MERPLLLGNGVTEDARAERVLTSGRALKPPHAEHNRDERGIPLHTTRELGLQKCQSFGKNSAFAGDSVRLDGDLGILSQRWFKW